MILKLKKKIRTHKESPRQADEELSSLLGPHYLNADFKKGEYKLL